MYCVDCIEGMASLDPESVDIIVTSPPYNVGTNYTVYEDTMTKTAYSFFMEGVFDACCRVLKDTGSFFFNFGGKPSDSSSAIGMALLASDFFALQNTIHWIKHISIPEYQLAVGHFKPINSKRYLNNVHEYIFHFTKKGDVTLDKLALGVPYKDQTNISRWGSGSTVRDRGNVWFIPYETTSCAKSHPAAFPKKLPTMCIQLAGFNASTVALDPFVGSGATCIAAKELGCQYLGFDIDPSYIELAKLNLG